MAFDSRKRVSLLIYTERGAERRSIVVTVPLSKWNAILNASMQIMRLGAAGTPFGPQRDAIDY